MAAPVAKNELTAFFLGQAIDRQSVLLLFGAALFAAGLLLMYTHRRDWVAVLKHERKLRNLKFELKKFRRRALVGSLLSALGAIMAALSWVHEPRTFVILTVVMCLLLFVMLGLGLLDFMSVWLHEFSTVDDRAKQEMVRKALELHEARKQQQRLDASASAADPQPTELEQTPPTPPN